MKKYHHAVIFCGYILAVGPTVSATSTHSYACLCDLDGVGLWPGMSGGGFFLTGGWRGGCHLDKVNSQRNTESKKVKKIVVLDKFTILRIY